MRSEAGPLRVRPSGLAGIALFGIAVTVFVSAVPAIRFAYRAPSLHVALETAAGIIALLAAYLVIGRFRESKKVADLVLASALAALAVSNLAFAALPVAAFGTRLESFSNGASLTGRLLGAILIVSAAWLPATKLVRSPRIGTLLAGGLPLALGLTAGAVWLFAPSLPVGIDPSLSPETASRPGLAGNAALLAVQLASATLYAAAFIGFSWRHRRSGDELMDWFAAGTLLAAISCVNYFLFPSLYSDWVYTGDFFRLLFYLVILVGAANEIGRYWKRMTEAAVLEERRRIARDLHDGAAQELAFILRRAQLTPASGADSRIDEIAAAAERGLDESRRAIAALTRPVDEPLDVVLTQALEEAGGRLGASIAFDLEPGITVGSDVRESLVRIAREAVSNAIRHGQVSTVRVELTNADKVRLRVVDEGLGFDPAAVASGTREGFGLVSMQERARALGAEFRLESGPIVGTTVEVILP